LNKGTTVGIISNPSTLRIIPFRFTADLILKLSTYAMPSLSLNIAG
jgi:hypothetical protein